MTERKIDFLYVGPQRTSSSWLHKYLEPHPELVFPKNIKETTFLDRWYDKGWDWYWAHFDEPADGQLVGEIAPTCIDILEIIDRVRHFDNLKVIIGVRDPVERTFSTFRHYRSRGYVKDDFFESLKKIPRIETSGQYAKYCPVWEQAFGRDNVLYLVYDDVVQDPQGAFDQVTDFLAIERLKLGEESLKPFGAAKKPPSALLVKVCSLASRYMRSARLNFVVEFSKKIGVSRLIRGGDMGEEKIPDDVQKYLVDLHQPDRDYLEHRLERRFDAWYGTSDHAPLPQGK